MRTRSGWKIVAFLLVAPAMPAQQTVDEMADMAPRLVTGRVVLEDGSPLPGPALVRISNYAGFEIWSGYTDKRGSFMTKSWGPSITAELAGYRVVDVKRNLRTEREFVIVLRPTLPGEGVTVSLSDLRAPEQAKKAHSSGAAALKAGKLAAADAAFRKAVGIYPEYATAWYDLGIVLERQGDRAGAQSAYSKALDADPKYIQPYVRLAALTIDESKWEDAAGICDRLLALNPLDFPEAFYFAAAASFNRKRLDAAEQHARRAIELDRDHRVPRAEYLLGAILANKRDFRGAAEHMRAYLQLEPRAPDAAAVKANIEEAERRAATAPSAAPKP